jgi:hypothetical protein
MVAIAVGVAMVGALILADSGSNGTTVERTTYVVERLPAHPVSPPPPIEKEVTQPPPDPVPALSRKPAAGPAFAIARLRPGARASMWSAPGGGLVETLGPRTEFGSPVVLSVVKRRSGWLGVASADLPNGRLGWIRDDPTRIDVYWTEYSLHANLSGLSLSLHYGSKTVGRFLVTVGGPGTETPAGRYGVTDALSFDESPFYGCCALALSGRQTSLPSDWIGGDRLAIHGTPGPVGAAESHGCIRATDTTMRLLFERIPLGTPVFVRE